MAQQFSGNPIPFGYGDGPGCQGLTPAQTNSIYGAPTASPRTTGKGVTIAVFELSAYQHSDIDTWAHTFYGPTYTPPLTDVNVDGGPLTPQCPVGDTCPANFNGYAGDIEVDADIEMQLAIAPNVKGSSTIGVKKSIVCTRARSGVKRYTPASSAVSKPTRTFGLAIRGIALSTLSNNFGLSLDAQPAAFT